MLKENKHKDAKTSSNFFDLQIFTLSFWLFFIIWGDVKMLKLKDLLCVFASLRLIFFIADFTPLRNPLFVQPVLDPSP